MVSVRLIVKYKAKQNYNIPKQFCSNFLAQIAPGEKKILPLKQIALGTEVNFSLPWENKRNLRAPHWIPSPARWQLRLLRIERVFPQGVLLRARFTDPEKFSFFKWKIARRVNGNLFSRSHTRRTSICWGNFFQGKLMRGAENLLYFYSSHLRM